MKMKFLFFSKKSLEENSLRLILCFVSSFFFFFFSVSSQTLMSKDVFGL